MPDIQVCEILIYPTRRPGDCQSVKRTLDPSHTSVQDMGINHCRADVVVSEKFLDRPDIISVLKQVCCKGVAQSVAPGRFEDASLEPSFFESFLYNRFVKMMSAFLSSDPINVMAGRRKNPLSLQSIW
jgi:hypothetical protein